MIPKELITQLETHEGKHYSIYLDKFGIKTIGIGFNLESKQNQEALSHYSIDIHELLRGRELTESEILLLFSISYNTAVADVKAIFGDTYEDLPTNIQYALIDMAFNMGRGKLLQFEKMIYHLKRHEYQYAAGEILNSKWYKQVGTRGYDIYMQIHP
jgi:lysozyme